LHSYSTGLDAQDEVMDHTNLFKMCSIIGQYMVIPAQGASKQRAKRAATRQN
jgi:hypothetical protein